MTIAETTVNAWNALPLDSRVTFYNIASKPGSEMTGLEWFSHLVPSNLQDNPQEIEVFMNGGTVTQDVWVHDQGVGNGHYEQVSFDIADKDVSRIQSGQNGGQYTADNTVMEDISTNRSRGGADMTTEELSDINEINAFEADVIDGSEILFDSTEATLGYSEVAIEATDVITPAVEGADLLGMAGDLISDAIAPAIGAYTAGKYVADKCDTTTDKVGFGSLAAGGAALVCMTPVGQAGLALYCGCKLAVKIEQKWGKQISAWWNKPVPWAVD